MRRLRPLIVALVITACDAGADAPAPAEPIATSAEPVAGAAPTVNEVAGLPKSEAYALRLAESLYFVSRGAVTELLAEAIAGGVHVDRVGDGWRVLSIRRDAIVEGLGLQVGDVIRTVDGAPVATADALVELVRALPQRQELVVALDRDGTSIERRYALRDADTITRAECIEQLLALVRLGVDGSGGKIAIDRVVLEQLASPELEAHLRAHDRTALVRALGFEAGEVVAVDESSLTGADEVLGALGRRAPAQSLVVEVRTDFGTRPLAIDVVTGRVEAADVAAVVARLAAAPAVIRTPPPRTPDEPLVRPPEPVSPAESPSLDAAALGIVAIDETHYRIPKVLRDELAADPMKIAKAARVVPAIRDDKPAGFKLYGIRKRGDFSLSWLGLKNGDTVVAVSGVDLRAIDDVLDAVPKWKKATKLVVEIERKGKPIELVWTFE